MSSGAGICAEIAETLAYRARSGRPDMPAGGMTAVPQEDADSSSWMFLVTKFDGAAELLGGG